MQQVVGIKDKTCAESIATLIAALGMTMQQAECLGMQWSVMYIQIWWQ